MRERGPRVLIEAKRRREQREEMFDARESRIDPKTSFFSFFPFFFPLPISVVDRHDPCSRSLLLSFFLFPTAVVVVDVADERRSACIVPATYAKTSRDRKSFFPPSKEGAILAGSAVLYQQKVASVVANQ